MKKYILAVIWLSAGIPSIALMFWGFNFGPRIITAIDPAGFGTMFGLGLGVLAWFCEYYRGKSSKYSN